MPWNEFELTKRRWNYSSTGRKMVQNLPHSYPVIHLSQRKMYSVVVKIQWNRVRQFGFHDFIKIIESTRTQIRQANWRFELADAADYDDTIMSLKARRKQDKLISNHKKKEKKRNGETRREMKRTSQRSTDFMISFPNSFDSLSFLFWSRKTWNWSWIDWTTYFDGKSANPERRPPHSDHLLGGINLVFSCFVCSWFFVLCAKRVLLYKNTKGITDGPIK
jgi:hypothetical protein